MEYTELILDTDEVTELAQAIIERSERQAVIHRDVRRSSRERDQAQNSRRILAAILLQLADASPAAIASRKA